MLPRFYKVPSPKFVCFASSMGNEDDSASENEDANPPSKPLADDILIDIFSRLPVKCLLRLRCVSKSWHALISSNDVNKKLPSAMSGLFSNNSSSMTIQYASLHSRTYVDDSTSIDTSLSFFPPSLRSILQIVDCRNGLLLLKTCHTSGYLYVCNPSTSKWAQISKPPKESVELALGFEPGCSVHYKIVSFAELVEDELSDPWNADLDLEIYSSETGEWTDVQRMSGISKAEFRIKPAIFSNGLIYFQDNSDYCTVAIDIEERDYETIQDPDKGEGFIEPLRYLGLSRGLLHYSEESDYERIKYPDRDMGFTEPGQYLGISGGLLHYASIMDNEMVVWVLDDGYEFASKHRMGVQKLKDLLHTSGWLASGGFEFVAFHPDLDVVFCRMQGKVMSCHLKTAQLEEICDDEENDEEKGRWFPYSPCYLENLDLPEGSCS